MDAVNLFKNFCAQDDAPTTLAVCSTLLKVTALIATVFTFFVYSPWLLVATAASVSLDFFILKNPEYFQKADEWVAKTVQKVQGKANQPHLVPLPGPAPIRNDLLVQDVALAGDILIQNGEPVRTVQGTVRISSDAATYYVATDAQKFYQHVKLADGSPVVQTEHAFFLKVKLHFKENPEEIEANLKKTTTPLSLLTSDLFEGLQEGDHLKFLMDDKVLFDLELEEDCIAEFNILKKKAHPCLTEDDARYLYKGDFIWGQPLGSTNFSQGITVHLSPTTSRLIPGSEGTQPCDFATLPKLPPQTISLGYHIAESEIRHELIITLEAFYCSEETQNKDLHILIDNNYLYAYYQVPPPNNRQIVPRPLVDYDLIWVPSPTDRRFACFNLSEFLNVEELETAKIRTGPINNGLVEIFFPLLRSVDQHMALQDNK